MGHPLKLLLIEDSAEDAALLSHLLKKEGFDLDVTRIEGAEALREELRRGPWDVVISDFNLPRLTGLQALEIVRSVQKDLPFILVSGSVGEQLAVQAMRAGAQDYIMKDNPARLAAAVRREMAEAGERRKRREAEAALEEKNKQLIVAQRMEAIGRLAGGIAHDLNNMIGAGTIYAEMALEPGQDLAVVQDYVREIARAQERATLLVRQLLAFSRKQVIDPQVMSVNQVIADIYRMLAQILGEDIDLAVDLAPDLMSIQADPGQIDQVIMNLVVNARDAMPKGGMLTIRTSNETVSAGDPRLGLENDLGPGKYVKLTVTDTGTGIEDAILTRIFEPFFTTKEVGKGTGLGLATVYGIVKQSSGDIRVKSEMGKGTTFELLFKAVTPAPAPSPRVPEPTRVDHAVGTLLLVEDEIAVQQALVQALTRLGYKLHVASNGEQALKLYDQHQADIELLISDVVMPKMSGPDMADEMRRRNPSLKVLFVSGYGADMLKSYGIDHKSTFLMAKPFSIKQLAAKITEIIGDRP
ncbi:MAG TPA: response regulator [Bdellovibrionota bacterium]|nr:response regulator [Bdellovibrionota bacterium]